MGFVDVLNESGAGELFLIAAVAGRTAEVGVVARRKGRKTL